MDYEVVIFWMVCLSCVAALVVIATRAGLAARGWLLVYGGILLVAVLGQLWHHSVLVYAALGLWFLLVLCPALLSKYYSRHFYQQRYAAARRIARLIGWLHPADGWRQQTEILQALELAQRGDFTAARETLLRFHGAPSLVGLTAMMNLYRMTSQWDELLSLLWQHSRQVTRHPQFLPVLLRAYGETGNVPGMVELYHQNRHRIARLVPATSRDFCRLMLFAFCGKRASVERLFAGSLAILPDSIREFWLATAERASGDAASAQRRLEQLLPAADPPLQRAIARRLSQVAIPPEPLPAAAEDVLEEAAREQSHEENFGAQRSLFSKRALATQFLILLNVLAFLVETARGGSTNPDTLYRLGALFAPAARAGEWWRLVTSLFLHWGPLHLGMNMFALCVLGPFAEFALGFRRFLLVYLLAGIGSMAVVMTFASGPDGEQLTVGASGCIMGLVGATGALMLRGWLRHKAFAARRRFMVMVLIVGMQSIFDALVPQVSMTAHLSGALIGFGLTLLLRDNLKSASPPPIPQAPQVKAPVSE